MGTHEREHNKKESLRPLVIADVHEFVDKWFLIAVMYEEGYVIANIVTPLDQLVKEGGTIPNKLREIVFLNSRNPSKNMAFDVMTNTNVIYGELLKESEILCLLVEAEKTTETKRNIENPHVQEWILEMLEQDENKRLKALAELKERHNIEEIPKEERSLFGKGYDWITKLWRGLKV
ncbi:hypothetical protein CN503_05760 [Bacillus cereus]|uniref:hypothetical protein n=1 Tax=Bacillus cereus TaxID=1396 RepID=UPI000BED9A9E|nr:hypothetical protein [Bacillus cereus]PED90956.1 hypothetical protein CON43_02750 [Bacillus cereus]PER69648.1 hypothetical protein CN503_05760 [Bacillus cereus]